MSVCISFRLSNSLHSPFLSALLWFTHSITSALTPSFSQAPRLSAPHSIHYFVRHLTRSLLHRLLPHSFTLCYPTLHSSLSHSLLLYSIHSFLSRSVLVCPYHSFLSFLQSILGSFISSDFSFLVLPSLAHPRILVLNHSLYLVLFLAFVHFCCLSLSFALLACLIAVFTSSLTPNTSSHPPLTTNQLVGLYSNISLNGYSLPLTPFL